MIIAERSYCDSVEDWIQRIAAILENISKYSDVIVQIRNKELVNDWAIIAPYLTDFIKRFPHKISLNGSIFPQYTIGRHLPEADIDVYKTTTLLGASIHSIKSLRFAESNHVDYVQIGAIFPTAKPVVPIGLQSLKNYCNNSIVPVLAVGGINSILRVQQCLDAGTWGVSIGRWILQSSNPRTDIESIRAVMYDHI